MGRYLQLFRLFACGVLLICGSVSLTSTANATRADRPFWAEKSAFVEGDELFVVGVASNVATLEEGRQQAFDHGKIELMNFAQLTDLEAQGLVIETQMTYEETNPDGTVNVFRLLRVSVETLRGIQGRLRAQSRAQEQAIEQERRALIRLQQALVHTQQDLETRTRSVEQSLTEVNQLQASLSRKAARIEEQQRQVEALLQQLNQTVQPESEQGTGSVAMPEQAVTLYACDDGQTVLLTDNASLGCPVYEPQAQLITVRDGATWAEVEWAVATSNPEAFQPREQPTRIVQPEAARRDVCQQWIDLNRMTDGTLDMGGTANTQTWLALSRIVTATNLCEEYMDRPVYPQIR